MSSPVQLHSLDSLDRVCVEDKLLSRQQAPLSMQQPVDPRERYCLGTNSVAGVAGVALSCQTAVGTRAPDFLLGFTPLAFPRMGRPQGRSGLISQP